MQSVRSSWFRRVSGVAALALLSVAGRTAGAQGQGVVINGRVLTESGGMRWTAKGTDGCIARVSFPAPGLVSQIELGSEESNQILAIAGNEFSRLFAAVKAYQPVPDFRAQAVAVLPSPKVKALFDICETDSAPRVSFEAAKRVEPANAR